MKLEENLTYKMMKLLRFFRRERRSVDVSDESTEAGKGTFGLILTFSFL